MKKRLLLVNGAVGLAAVAGGIALHRSLYPEVERAGPATGPVRAVVGTALPGLRFTDRAGAERSLQELGSRLLVNVWATWCPPCRVEVPDLQSAARRHPHLTIVGLALDRPDAVWRFVDELGVDYPVLIHSDEAGIVHAAFRNTSEYLPYSVLAVDGTIVAAHLGALSPDDLDVWAAAIR